MNWKKVNKIYNKIQEYEHELDVLKQLGKQIAEDNRSIEVDISHIDTNIEPEHNYSDMFHPRFFEYSTFKNSLSKKGLDIDPFYLELKDQHALEFIGNTIKLLTKQLERFKSQLKELE